MRTLVTNDDGVASPGILALARAALDLEMDVTVAAPGWDSSGASASLAAVEDEGRFLVREHDLGVDGLPAFAVEAAPAFIVRAAVHGAFGDPPDLVLSGVNNGPNTGHAVLHSGTVGAALTASTFRRPAAAFSIGIGDDLHWETARGVARDVVEWLAESEADLVLNVNVPNVPPDALRGLESARLAAFGAVQVTATDVGEGYVKLEYEEMRAEYEPGTDAALLADGFATVTALTAVCEAPASVEGLRDRFART